MRACSSADEGWPSGWFERVVAAPRRLWGGLAAILDLAGRQVERPRMAGPWRPPRVELRERRLSAR